jgi:hypothetical protein
MASGELDLAAIFQTVTQVLASNQSSLNQADDYNHDHGDHMVEIFNLVTQAAQKKGGKPAADQLAYASKVLGKQAKSGSAKVYAEGLARAAQQFKGRSLQPDNALELVELLMGSQTTAQPGAQAAPETANLLGSLLGSLGGEPQAANDGFDMGDVLSGGLAFLQSRQRGESTLEALMDAVMAGSQVGQTPHRAQSGKLVSNTLLQMLSGKLTNN